MPDGADRALVLDTHVWIWMMEGNSRRLSARARGEIEAVSQAGTLWLAAISVWEVALMEALSRVSLSQPVREWIEALLRGPGARLLPLEPEIAVDSTRLPGSPHADPADRILMSSARITGARLVTCDARILRYASDGHVPVLDARP